MYKIFLFLFFKKEVLTSVHRIRPIALALLALSATGLHAAEPIRIAFLAASSENGYNQGIMQGIRDEARRRGAQVEIFNGEFDPARQYAQVEDVVTSGRFKGMVICPNDPSGIAAAAQEAIAGGLKVAAVLFPIGPRLDTLAPQLPGLLTTVAWNPVAAARIQAQTVVDDCSGRDPCRVVIIIGQKTFPFDELRDQTYRMVLAAHPNIRIVADVEGDYDPDRALTAMQDVLQAHPKVDVVLTNSDQHLVGADLALDDAGIRPGQVDLVGAGASGLAFDGITDGRWQATLKELPQTEGRLAVDTILDSIEGRPVAPEIDEATLGGVPPMIDRRVLAAHPDFRPQWPG